jgi:hypothetical protein
MTREELITKIGSTKIGTEQHTLLLCLEANDRYLDVCVACKKLVHASLACSCGKPSFAFPVEVVKQVVSFPVEAPSKPIYDPQSIAAMVAALRGQKVW